MSQIFPTLKLPQPEIQYLHSLTDILQAELNVQLKAVYLFGSASYGAYEPGRSDLDLAVIIDSSLANVAYQHLCSHITHTSLPCPARKLELVIYTLSTIQNLTRFPQFSLNFNTGANMGDHVTLDPTQEAGHWFLLDLAVGRELGVALLGPDPKGLIGEVKREWVIDALRESVNWWERNEGTSADAVLNACRGWRWVRCGVWESKVEGAKWVVENEPGVRGVVESAIEARGSKMELGGKKVLQLLKVVKEEMSSV